MHPIAIRTCVVLKNAVPTILGLIVSGLIVTTSSYATSVSYTFSANVSSIWGTSFYGIHPVVGDVLSGVISYDTSASNLLVSPVEKKYFESTPLSFGFTLRGLTFRSDGAFTIDVSNQTQSGGIIVHTIQLWDNDSQIKINNAPASTVGFDLDFTIHNGGSNLDLPNNLTSLGPISFKHGSVTAPNAAGITYDLTTITLVPEPTTISLIGLCGIIAWRRQRGARENSVRPNRSMLRLFDTR